jgi:hypothetical protein
MSSAPVLHDNAQAPAEYQALKNQPGVISPFCHATHV